MPGSSEFAKTQRILIVEDEVMLAKDLDRSLRNLGYEVLGRVSSAEEAIRLAQGSQPDLILMDVKLNGDKDGIEAAEIIRTRFDIPVVYLTGFSEKDVLDRAKRTEPYGYLSKPVGLMELRSTVETALHKHKADHRIRESEERYRTLYNKTPALLHSIDADGKIVSVSDRWLEIMGYDREEVIGRPSLDFLTEESRRIAEEFNLPEFFKEGFAKDVPYKFVTKAGAKIDVLMSAIAEHDSHGKFLRSLAVLDNITEQIIAEDSAAIERDRAQRYLDTARVMMLAFDKDGNVTLANKKACETLGYEKEEIIGKNWFQNFLPERHREQVYNAFFQVIAGITEPFDSYENPILTKSGEERIIAWSNTFVKDEHGKIVSGLASGEDITDRKKAQEKLIFHQQDLAKLNQKLRRIETAVRKASVAIFGIKNDGRFWYVNDTACDTLKRSREELLDLSVHDVDPNFSSEARPDHWRRIQESGNVLLETVHRSKDGRLFPVEVSSNYFKFDDEELEWAFAQDITERKRWEDQIKASLTEKEVLLREIHHRVKNNLAIINSLLSLRAEYASDKSAQEMFDEVKTRIRSMAVAHEILYQSDNLAHLGVRDYIGNLLNHILYSHGSIGTTVSLEKEIDEVSFGLNTAIPLGFLITELASNCLKHAFPDGRQGKVRVSLRSVDEHEFELTVADDGVGIPESVDFENPRSMGMDLIDTFVDQLHGRIEINKNDGTEVRIRFKEIGYKA